MHLYMSGTPKNDAFQVVENQMCSHRLFSMHGEYAREVMKRAVEMVAAPEVKVAKRVAKAIAKFFSPDFDRAERVHMWDRRASLRPLNPGAG